METPFGKLDLLDAHVHYFSHRFFATLAKQAREVGSVDRVGKITGWSMPSEEPADLADRWIAELDRNGVWGAMMIASVPGDETSVAAAVAAHPDRIAGAFMIDPTAEDAVERAKAAFDELHLRVPCLFPAMHRYSVAENDKVRAIAALSAERPGTAVFIHFGALSVGVRNKLGLPSHFDLRYSNPVDLHPLAARMPSTTFVVPHFGAGMFREALMVASLCPNVYFDTSSSNAWIKYETGVRDLADVFRRALDVVGPERLLFGTDSSFFPRGWHAAVFRDQIAALQTAGVNADEAQAILGGNLRKVLGLK